ncbi:MAG TPA: hypothetical protein VJ937_13320 [Salinivirga sp.]|uniref:hypothetical protein n=1 Tax=Salinivirga sp. TaxID=1970192 RepID=UPI002B4671B9|nr:hypothetical protein [Salinivirga sp.]HKK60453.1 hypothetical protein [Salinivirga sp.]
MKFFLRGLFLLSVVFLFLTCKEDDSFLGENFLDSKLSIYYDTVTNFTTTSVPYDINDTVYSGVTLAMIGDYYDEIFGDTKAMTVFSVAPQFNVVDSASNRNADSLMLQLQFRGTYYGFDTTEQTFHLYAVEQPLNQIDTNSLANVNLSDYYDPNSPIATTTYAVKPDTGLLQFKLPASMANDLVQNLDTLISSDSVFVNNFMGFIVTAERQEGNTGALIHYNFNAEETHMRLLYNDENSDDQVLYFYPTSQEGYVKRFNFFDHDYSTGSISNQMISMNHTQFITDDSLAYIQAGRGINLEIDVDLAGSEIFADDMNNEELVINRVRLELNPIKREFELVDTLMYAPPEAIIIYEDVNGEKENIVDYFIPDRGMSAPEYYNDEENSYGFVFSGMVHEKVNEGNSSFKLFLQPSQTSITANRAVFYGSGAVDSLRPKVIITYSKRTNE